MVFYDVSTLYFESDLTDELREKGWSKDGKHSHPQVVLGLLVSKDGYPLAYSLFNGSQYEGRTMIPVVEDFARRLKASYKSGTISKENINKRGYNKFLELSDNVTVTINQDKIDEDEKWDGLKGYITNTGLPAKEVYEQYNGLWVIERAYRVTKGTLEMRPMFHFTPKRIEAHVCICFVAYKVYKELERILKLGGINLSVDKVLNIAKTITSVKVNLPIHFN